MIYCEKIVLWLKKLEILCFLSLYNAKNQMFCLQAFFYKVNNVVLKEFVIIISKSTCLKLP